MIHARELTGVEMSNLFWLTDAQMERLRPFFPKSHGRGYDADWFRDALKDKGIKPCIPGRKTRGTPVKHDKRRNRIEIMFGRLKDWRRVATRYDRCPKVFLSAVALAATVMSWLWVLSLKGRSGRFRDCRLIPLR